MNDSGTDISVALPTFQNSWIYNFVAGISDSSSQFWRRIIVNLPDLLFGVATSDHQAEAYDGDFPDFRDEWEKRQGQTLRGKATDFWNRHPEDIGLARDLGCKIFRYSISWSRVEPQPGEFSVSALDHYLKVTAAVRDAGMLPLVTLHHFTWPIHVEQRGGMTAKDFPHWYANYVKAVVQVIGDHVPYWVTFNEPNLLVYGFVKPWWQPGFLVPPGTLSGKTLSEQLDKAGLLIRNIFLAHRLGRQAIRNKNSKAKVGANPFVLGLPGPLQFFIDWLATRTKSNKTFKRQNRKVAEQPILAFTAVDIVVCRFTPTRERAASVAFSHPYAEGAERLVLRRDSGFTKIRDLGGKTIGYVRGSIAGGTISKFAPTAHPQPFNNHREGLLSLQAGVIDGFVADDVAIVHTGLPSGLVMGSDILRQCKYAVGMAKGNPDLLSLVNAVVEELPSPPVASRSHGPILDRILRRGYLRVGIGCDPGEVMSQETTAKEAALAKEIGQRIFGREGCVAFRKVDLDQRVSLLSSWSKVLEPLLKTMSVVGTVLNSNWWHLGMAGKLPEFLCPKECVGLQDYVGLDYYWGIDSFELSRMHQLIDASMSHFDGAPVDPSGLFRVLNRFHRWFPKLEIVIIENGCIESADNFTRAEYLRAHVREVTRARALGIPVRAYIYWSITSNREWGLPFGAASDFGLFHIDLDNDPELRRVPTICADLYKQIVREETVQKSQ
jgi:beta-glucosidase/6-phospho-beta-glucosidase/beta-galactosidase